MLDKYFFFFYNISDKVMVQKRITKFIKFNTSGKLNNSQISPKSIQKLLHYLTQNQKWQKKIGEKNVLKGVVDWL